MALYYRAPPGRTRSSCQGGDHATAAGGSKIRDGGPGNVRAELADGYDGETCDNSKGGIPVLIKIVRVSTQCQEIMMPEIYKEGDAYRLWPLARVPSRSSPFLLIIDTPTSLLFRTLPEEGKGEDSCSLFVFFSSYRLLQ